MIHSTLERFTTLILINIYINNSWPSSAIIGAWFAYHCFLLATVVVVVMAVTFFLLLISGIDATAQLVDEWRVVGRLGFS